VVGVVGRRIGKKQREKRSARRVTSTFEALRS
jgi:hypothetical protein